MIGRFDSRPVNTFPSQISISKITLRMRWVEKVRSRVRFPFSMDDCPITQLINSISKGLKTFWVTLCHKTSVAHLTAACCDVFVNHHRQFIFHLHNISAAKKSENTGSLAP